MNPKPVYAHFQHPNGNWYRLWITRTTPKTERGHTWHLHATYDKTGTLAPIAGTRWYNQPYGMTNWNFDTETDVIAAFRSRARDRLAHGYEIMEGAVP